MKGILFKNTVHFEIVKRSSEKLIISTFYLDNFLKMAFNKLSKMYYSSSIALFLAMTYYYVHDTQ